MSDKNLEKQINIYSELGKEDPNVNVSMLMINALQKEGGSGDTSKSYRTAYLVSIGLPPFGLIYAVKYYFSDDENDKQAALICVLLTAISIIVFVVLSKLVFSSSGTSLQQIEQISPKDIQQLTQ